MKQKKLKQISSELSQNSQKTKMWSYTCNTQRMWNTLKWLWYLFHFWDGGIMSPHRNHHKQVISQNLHQNLCKKTKKKLLPCPIGTFVLFFDKKIIIFFGKLSQMLFSLKFSLWQRSKLNMVYGLTSTYTTPVSNPKQPQRGGLRHVLFHPFLLYVFIEILVHYRAELEPHSFYFYVWDRFAPH